jgi:hypothetical protein
MGSALPVLGLPSRADFYGAALEGLTRVNELILDKRPDLPPLYAAGVRWKNRPHENWRRADMIACEGWGDCEGIASWRAAELRQGRGVYGECDPFARVNCYHTGPKKYHAIVMRGDDTIEDPSVVLGMPVRPGMPRDRAEMNWLNGMWPNRPRPGRLSPASVVIGQAEDDDPGFKTDITEQPDGQLVAQLQIPLADGRAIIAKAQGAVDKAQATANAVKLVADTAADVAKNPILLAQMNPYTAAAVQLYTSPEVRKSLGTLAQGARALGGSAVNLFRRIF